MAARKSLIEQGRLEREIWYSRYINSQNNEQVPCESSNFDGYRNLVYAVRHLKHPTGSVDEENDYMLKDNEGVNWDEPKEFCTYENIRRYNN